MKPGFFSAQKDFFVRRSQPTSRLRAKPSSSPRNADRGSVRKWRQKFVAENEKIAPGRIRIEVIYFGGDLPDIC
jgi:hypothetical protein